MRDASVRTSMRILIYVVFIFAPVTAAADISDPDLGTTMEGSVAARMGSYQLDGVDTGEICLHSSLGMRHDRLALVGAYDYCGTTWPGMDTTRGGPASSRDADGSIHQLALFGRWYFAHLSMKPADVWLAGDFFAEVGGGEQLLDWDGGGRLTRPDFEFGIGGHEVIHAGHTKFGLEVALHAAIARRPNDIVGPPTCAGPCDTPTRPSAYDHSIRFDIGIMFGR